METNRLTRGALTITTEELVELVKENPVLYNQLLKTKTGIVSKSILLLYPNIDIAKVTEALPEERIIPHNYRTLTNEEFDSIYEFEKYPIGRAWLLEAFKLTNEVSELDHIHQHIYRHAAPPGFKRNPDYEDRNGLYPE